MALATRVECNEESDGFGGKSDGNEGGRQLTVIRVMVLATAMKWVMLMVTRRLFGDKEGKGAGGKGNDDGDEGDRRQRGNGDGGKSNGDGDNGGRQRPPLLQAPRQEDKTAARQEAKQQHQPARLDGERAAQ